MNHPPIAPASVPDAVDVFAIRKAHGRMFGTDMTQEAFAHLYGFKPSTVADWEQGHSTPDRSSRILLTVIQHEAPAVRRALRQARDAVGPKCSNLSGLGGDDAQPSTAGPGSPATLTL